MSEWAPELRARLSGLRLTPEREAEIVEELSQHLDDRRRELIAGGTDAGTATRLILADLNERDLLARYMTPLLQSQSTPMPPIGAPLPALWSPSGWLADVRHAWRAIRRTPLQTATVVTSLTIGTTLSVLMFGVVNAMVSGSIPGIRERDRLVRLGIERVDSGYSTARMRMGDFWRLPASIPGLESYGGELPRRFFSAHVKGVAVTCDGMFVTGAYFSTLGTRPARGRLIGPADDRAGAPQVVVIGHQFWLRHFGGDPGVVGAIIRVGTGAYQVIGVLPPRFVGIDEGNLGETSDERAQLWLPMNEIWTYPDAARAARVDRAAGPRMVGRLATGIRRSDAEGQAQGIVAGLDGADAAGPSPRRMQFQPLSLLPSSTALQTTLFIGVLMSVPFIVLGIACANVGGIQLARAVSRTHDLSIRMSLGASRLRVVRLVAVETGLMALAAGALAWGVATQTLRLAGNVLPFAVAPDARVFVFSMALAVTITLVAGFAPAWRGTGIDVLAGLRLGPRVGRAAGSRLRRGIVAGQIALSVLLLVLATFLIRSITSLGSAVGPLQEGVFMAAVGFSDLGVDAERARHARSTVAQSVGRLAGVSESAVSAAELFGGASALCQAGEKATRGTGYLALGVTPGFFDTLGIGVHRGRAFTAADRAGVVVVNEAFLATLPDGAGLGAIVTVMPLDDSPFLRAEVVGVVENSYERVPTGHARPRCYLPFDPALAGNLTILARSTAAAALAPAVHQILADIDPRLSVRESGTVAQLIRARYRWLYWIADALGVVSLVALALAAVGLFALMSYAVSQRTNEFGIRLVLGAHPWNISADVMRESLTVALAGTTAGILAAIPIAMILGSEVLSTISWRDPVPPAIIAGLLIAVAIVATLAPAWRVFRTDPVSALRQE